LNVGAPRFVRELAGLIFTRAEVENTSSAMIAILSREQMEIQLRDFRCLAKCGGVHTTA